MSSTPASPAARTESQRQAARQNGRKSTGPRSPGGRISSSRNALKHGLSGSGKVLPADLEADVANRRLNLWAAYKPRDGHEQDLLETAALGLARMHGMLNSELKRASERTRNAIKRWDERRAAEVAALARELAISPALALPKLRSTCEGCDYLGDSWLSLSEMLRDTGRIDGAGLDLGMNLLGSRLLERKRPPAADEFAALAMATRGEGEAAAEARVELAAFIDEAVAELVERGTDLWENHDKPDRDGAPDRAYFDAAPEGKLLARYINESERMQRRALAELHRYRREQARPAPARDEPEPQPAPEPEPAPASRNEPEPAAPAPAPPTTLAEVFARNEPGADLEADLGRLIGHLEAQVAASRAEPDAPKRPDTVA